MIALYLILTVGQCTCPTWNRTTLLNTVDAGLINGTANTYISNSVICPSPDVTFTTSEMKAEDAAIKGARVWRVRTMPLKIAELKATAKTTYSVAPIEIGVENEK